MSKDTNRRQFIKDTIVMSSAVLAGSSFEEKNLMAQTTQPPSAATNPPDNASASGLKGKLPYGQISKLKLSRIILGGNLIGGWAHARDLIYVSDLVKAYHTKVKIFETFSLAEQCGVNAILTNPVLCEVINDYWKSTSGKIQFISDCGGKDVLTGAKQSIDNGACACYFHGGAADSMVKQGNFDAIAEVVDFIRQNGLPAGIGGHNLETVQACVRQDILPDFWMKTLHPTSYWSAKHPQEYDNIWCKDPQETIAFMQTLEQPWIAYKVLAAGALHPQRGFRYAFASGADFICAGMYDFQLIEDINFGLDALSGTLKRKRPWMG